MVGIVTIVFFITCGVLLSMTIVGMPVVALYCFLVFVGAKSRASRAEGKLSETLMDDEKILHQGIQKRPYALSFRRKIIGITPSRVIVLSRGIIGGSTMIDFQWKDLLDAVISENVASGWCGSNLIFKTSIGVFEVLGIENSAARVIYKKSQAEEQAWEEKRRVRSLEEKRASAGGVTIGTSPNSGGEKSSSGSFSATLEIGKAKELLDAGTISDAEFQEIKSKILSHNY